MAHDGDLGMTKWRKGYRRTLTAWLISEGKRDKSEDGDVDELILREAGPGLTG